METVKQFGVELNSILDSRPPVSRAKMASITKLAMKSVKYYKHIVMMVEKFISKGSPEYKLPGLYVIDSIMRQSRHQFGADKDSFGPRFTKNMEKTFLHIFQCPDEDKPKCVRVLNLWQKNEVFTPEVIQPLLALASDHAPQEKPKELERHGDRLEPHVNMLEQHEDQMDRHGDRPPQPNLVKTSVDPTNSNLDLGTATTIIQQQQEQISALLQQQQQLQTQATSLLAPALQSMLVQQPGTGGIHQLETLSALLQQTQQLQQLQAIQQRLANGEGGNGGPVPAQISNVEPIGHSDQSTVFNKALLDDFDYSDEEEDMDARLAQQRERLNQQQTRLQESEQSGDSHSSPRVLEKLQNQFRQQELASASIETGSLPPPVSADVDPLPPLAQNEPHSYSSLLGHPPLPPSSDSFPSHPPPSLHSSFHPPPISHTHIHPTHPPPGPPPSRDWPRPPPPLPPHYPPPPRSPSPRTRRDRFSPPPPMRGRSPSPPPHRMWRERSRWSPPRRRSRSPPPHPRRHSRDRSRSPPSRWQRMSPPPEEQERRRKKGLPLPKDKHMTVCSTTLWVGHLPKIVLPDTVKQAFEDFGQVKSVELVQARGCAYVVMVHRTDAGRALQSLRDLRLGGNLCKIAWAPGRGVKGAGLKAFWEQDLGSSFIPWNIIKTQSVLNGMADGGWVDPRTCPPNLEPPPLPTDDQPMEETPAVPPPVEQIQQVAPQQVTLQQQQPPQTVVAPSTSAPSHPAANPSLPTSNVNTFQQPLTPSFQPPGSIPSQFPPRLPPNSQPMSLPMPAFSRPNLAPQNGTPFRGDIRPPMGGELRPLTPLMGMGPQQIGPGPPMGVGSLPGRPLLGVEPHSIAHTMGGGPLHPPPMGGGPRHSMAHIGGGPHFSTPPMGGGPQQMQLPMQRRPQPIGSMPQLPPGLPPTLSMMQIPSSRAMPQPFVPLISKEQELVMSTSTVSSVMPPKAMPPMGEGPLSMPTSMGERPIALPPPMGKGPPAMAPTMGEVPLRMPLTMGEGPSAMPPTTGNQKLPVMPPPMGEGPPAMPPALGEVPPAMPPPMSEGPPVMPPPMAQEPPSKPPVDEEQPVMASFRNDNPKPPVDQAVGGDVPPPMPPPVGGVPPPIPPPVSGIPPVVPPPKGDAPPPVPPPVSGVPLAMPPPMCDVPPPMPPPVSDVPSALPLHTNDHLGPTPPATNESDQTQQPSLSLPPTGHPLLEHQTGPEPVKDEPSRSEAHPPQSTSLSSQDHLDTITNDDMQIADSPDDSAL